MHDPAAQQDWVDFDFGITGLGASFHGDWYLTADDALDHVRAYLGAEGDPAGLVLLIEDILLLRDSALTGDELNLLWRATDPSGGGSPEIRGAERAWIEQLLGAVTTLARGRGASDQDCTAHPGCVPDGRTVAASQHRRLTADVLELIDLLDQGRSDLHMPLAPTQEALRRCALTVCSELAFRFLLNALYQSWAQLSLKSYGRIERLGTAFQYGPYVVDRLRCLTE
ncbi:hypothetical protein ACIQZO_13165 [Streptomyces sp. NPDC097617]|uniref:hypothetical protein n=1 Tax=Streptomyces sp. NPDC097617 TaxID=3366091 RepID=UPI00381F3D39